MNKYSITNNGKIYYPANERKSAFFKVHGYRVPLDECIRMGV